MTNSFQKPKHCSLSAIVSFCFIFTLKEASLEHGKFELRFESKIGRYFVSFSPDELWILDWKLRSWIRRAFVSFPCIKWRTVEFWISPSCPLQHGHLQWTSFPRYVYRDVQRFGSSVRLNTEECHRLEGAEASSRGKVPVFILLFFAVVVFVLFVSAPAHILCLTVASGWNKERCAPEILITVTSTAKPSILVNLLYMLTTREWL
jgi:hypothetical protein